jgi:DNA-binding NarL/FixJ family response regulator
MQRSTLVVDDDESRRRHIVHALSRRGLRYLDVADAFGAMAALGRADFGAVIAAEGRRTLSLRGLCQLARRRHPEVVIFVIHRDGSDPEAIPGILGVAVDVLPPSSGADAVAAAVEKALLGPPPEPSEELQWRDLPRTQENPDEEPTIKTPMAAPVPQAASSLAHDEPTERLERPGGIAAAASAAAPAPVLLAPPPTVPGLLFEGLFDGGSGPGLLLGIFSQELTGRLVVKDGPAAGALYFYRGEPVWADDPLGDAGLHRRLVQKGHLPVDARIDAVAQGQLLGSLVQRGAINAQQMHDFMRELVRDVTLAVTTAGSGAYRFEEDRKFLDVAPLLRVNPFGLVLESRRKSLPPQQLLALASDIEQKFLVPAPGLGTSSEKLAPFVRGARLSELIDGTKTVRQVLEYTNLDQFMGTLVIVSLRDCRLVTLEDQPRPIEAGGVTLLEGAVGSAEPEDVTVVDADYPTAPPSSHEDAKVRESILGLYMRLKPLTVPRQVLGVGLDADMSEIEAAFQARMRELDPDAIPEGSAQALLLSRVDELRRKITSAYQVLKLQAPTQAGIQVDKLDDDKTRKTNPF